MQVEEDRCYNSWLVSLLWATLVALWTGLIVSSMTKSSIEGKWQNCTDTCAAQDTHVIECIDRYVRCAGDEENRWRAFD